MKNYSLRSINLWLAALVLLAGCSQNPTAPSGSQAEQTKVSVRKSPNDSRNYRYLTLPNKMRVLLVSDAATEKSAAALTVFRGSFHEPQDRPGLAHFLEHMLFIQTETFPEIDGFQHHISSNGGSSNAYTAMDHTNYFFDIRPAAFDEALQRFAHFFIDPVLSPEYSQREKNAVHSEYQLQLKDDGWRGYMVGKQVLNPQHPGARFTIGSLETLSGDIHKDLVDFFDREYSADQMGLVVLSNESLDALQAKVQPLFGAVKNNDIGPDYPPMLMYTEAELPARVEIKTLKDGTQLSYNFPIPNTLEHYTKKPEQYITNLIGHEGAGSLYQLLSAKGWIENLGASVGNLDRNSSMVSISMELSEAGKDKVAQITDLLFQYIDMLKSTPPREGLYKEQAVVAELGFRFQEKSNPMGFVYQMAPRLDQFAPEDLLVAPYLMESFDPKLIQEYLAYLREDNLLLEISGADISGELAEPWFGVSYNLRRGPVPRKATPTDSFHLPAENPYLPEDLDLKMADEADIALKIDQPGMKLWMDTDLSFGTPRANLYLELAVAGGLTTPRDRAMAQLYRLLVNDALSEQTYPAYLAGLGYGISVPDSGFEISVGGYQDKQLILLDKVLDALLTTSIRADKFAQYKTSLIREWQNSLKDKPFTQAFGALQDVLRTGRWPRVVLAHALQEVDLAQMHRFQADKLSAISVQGLQHGNINKTDLDALGSLLQARLPISDHALIRARTIDIESPLRLQLTVDHDDSSMVLHLQDEDDSFPSRAKSALTAQLLHNAYFRELRTEQQLGYVVSANNRPVVQRAGISFVVQSPVASAAHLEEATRTFLTQFIADWPQQSDEEFAQQKLGLINRLRQTPKNLNEQSSRYWTDLENGHLTFDSREQIAGEVEQLTRADVAAYLAELAGKFNNRRLLIYTPGKFSEVPTKGALLSQATALKQQVTGSTEN